MKLKNTYSLLGITILALSVSTAILAQDFKQAMDNNSMGDKKEKVERLEPKDQCNMFLRFPIGGTPEQLVYLFGQPADKVDISILTYTWKVDDNFITLQYDRGSLTSVEIDKFCNDVKEGHEACDLFRDYKTNWPAQNIVEARLGKPVETGTISREEWLYKGETEKVYVELQDGGVEEIECIPVKYIYVPAKQNESKQKAR